MRKQVRNLKIGDRVSLNGTIRTVAYMAKGINDTDEHGNARLIAAIEWGDQSFSMFDHDLELETEEGRENEGEA